MENQNQGILSTGYKSLDECLGGINKGDYIVIGSWPGQGKSIFSLNIINNLLEKEKKVGFFSLQMTAEDATHRIICCGAGVESKKILDGSLTEKELLCVEKFVDKLQSRVCIIDDASSLNLSELRERAEKMIEQYSVEILFIDYIGYLQSDVKRQTYYEEMQEISKGIKRLSKDLHIPVVILCQLTRESEKEREKEGRAPTSTDIRDSSQIEADASSIIILEKDGNYEELCLCKLRVVKNSRGCLAGFKFVFNPLKNRFDIIEYTSLGKIQL